ncbi:MAG: hypothetical protein KGD66_00555 [Candidatus Lokiarchaeota archaeon]|nr:hypothetical protein [Candidatus Lokiarchaeota archaeon]
MTATTNINKTDGNFRHPDFLQSLNLDIRESKILKLFVKMKDNREINKLQYVFEN